MWTCRSFLGRPQPLLSRLRHVRRHASQPSAVLGGNNLIGSRGYASNSDGDSHAKAKGTKRHLYVVLDDHKDGYGIHKLDLDDDLDGGVQRLPDPPVLRVAFPAVNERAQFAAVGSSIVAIHSSPAMNDFEKGHFNGVFIYDTKTAAQIISPQLHTSLVCGYEAAMAVGNRLYMLESVGYERYYKYHDDELTASGLHCLTTSDGRGADVDDNKLWNWKPLSPSSRWFWSDVSDTLLMLPFNARDITAHAVHAPPGAAPHKHQIFVSVSYTPKSEEAATFFFGPPSRKWIRRGDWELPVVGHAHYDGELDTWIGLHAVEIGEYSRRTDGHLCTGHVMALPSEWKVSTEKLFRLEEDIAAGWKHIDAKLVPLDVNKDGSEYCLMERLSDGNKCLLRLTCFLVERGKDGEPVLLDRRRARSYKVSRYNTRFDAQAFWI